MADPNRISREEQLQPFHLTLDGPTGPYTLCFQADQDEGHFEVAIGNFATRWHVEICERTATGWRLAGMTRETRDLWGDCYWFEVHFGEGVRAEYGLKGLVRTDFPLP